MKRLWEWFDDARNGWAVAGIGVGAYVLLLAAVSNRWTIGGWPRPSLAMAVAGIAMGIGLLYKQPWARWLGVLWIVLALLVQVINGVTLGWTVGRTLTILMLAVGAGFFYVHVFRRWLQSEREDDDGKPFLSLVLLLREPRYLDSVILASLVSKAWDTEATTASEDGDEEDTDVTESAEVKTDSGRAFVVGDTPVFMVGHPLAMFMIHNHEIPYFDDVKKAAEGLVELRAKRAVLEHQAWVAVDVVHWQGEGDPTSCAYRMIARLLAELADDNVLAVIDPGAQQAFCYDPETERKLRSDDPLSSLRETYYAPIISVDSDDADMQVAVAEARRRWPEFVAAFEARQPDDMAFAVKAPFGEEGRVEFMWVEPTSIENDVIYGKLLNEPANVPGLHEGDRVTVPVADLNDFLCKVKGEAVGGFTMQAIATRAKQPSPHDQGDREGDE